MQTETVCVQGKPGCAHAPVASSIVVPAYNEASRIRPMLAAYAEAFEHSEIVVVCNGCVDETTIMARSLATKYQNIRVLEYQAALGKGGAILEGFRHARGEVVGFVDADESVQPSDYMAMYSVLSSCDGAIASRRIEGAVVSNRQPWPRRLASRAFNALVRILFGLQYQDTQCGAKVFTREAISDVIEKMTCTGFEFDVELLWRLRAAGRNVVEVPVTWKHAEGSTFSLRHAPAMLWSLLRLRTCE